MAFFSHNSYPFTLFPFIFLFMLLTTMNIVNASLETWSADTGPVIPTTPLVNFLQTLQETSLKTFGPKNFDPKMYVDLSLKSNLSTTIDAFDKLPRNATGAISVLDLSKFIDDYFEGAGDDLVYADPLDFVPEPEGFLPKVENSQVRAWALEVHSLWKNLSRKVSDSVLNRPEFHTLLPLPGPVVIPGSRFKEVNYWDSYWVIRGLMASKMYATAKSIVTNLISFIDTYGYVLNGARAYYTNRSQPPLLSAMIHEIYKRTGDLKLVIKALPALLKEYQFWNTGIHSVTVQDSQASSHKLSRYYAMWNKPRPESATIDKAFASKILNDSEKQHFYREVASTAESGWDFSTRWMRNTSDITTLTTTSILPVDLNVFVLRMELDIAFFAKVVGDNRTAKSFLKASQTRKRAINSVFWNEEKWQWLDYWFDNGATLEECQAWQASNQNHRAYASNYLPLWIDLFNSDTCLVKKVKKSLESSGLVCAVGIATSLINSGNQWDYPNGWAPLQHMIIEGLLRSGSEEARAMAEDIAVRWIRTNYVAYKKTGAMHEKYNVEKCGDFGGGGEYIPQTGFGWSNGVVLALLEEFGWPRDLKIDCQ
ncbi:probable trehalase [Pistacia vera]|uniref:probable trehalase n=1 Tax=Pistacia vera TaxID=55513 RepID=UPI001263E49F|nr:probable trehalase [Pistacia vera]